MPVQGISFTFTLSSFSFVNHSLFLFIASGVLRFFDTTVLHGTYGLALGPCPSSFYSRLIVAFFSTPQFR